MSTWVRRLSLCSSIAAFAACQSGPTPSAAPVADPANELTEFHLSGTGRAPDARGTLAIERLEGQQIVSIELENLPPPTQYAPKFDNYVVWFIGPDGNAQSVGVLTFDRERRRAATMATTSLDRFELQITAEPDIAVEQPNDIVVVKHQVDSTP